MIKVCTLASLLLTSTVLHSAEEQATLFYARSEMAADVIKFMTTNDLKIPVVLRDVSINKQAQKLAIELGKKCGLKGNMLNAYPLLVHHHKCVLNDKVIMEYLNEKKLVSRPESSKAAN